MPGMEWAFKLRDQVTQPAGNMESQLRRVTFALKTLDIASKQARLDKIADPLKKTRLELQIHRDKLLLSKRAIDEHSRSSKSWTDTLFKLAGVTVILDVLARAFRVVGHAAAEMGEEIREAVETRQRGLFGLRTNLGNQAGGNLFSQLQRQALIYGRPPGEIVGMGASFTDVGATPDLARRLVAATSDVRARTGGRVDIAEQIRSILSSPVVGVGNVEAFRGAFPLKRLWESLGKRMGMRPGDAEQFLNLHGVQGGPNSPLINALQDTVANLPGQGGLIGTTATRFAGTTLEGSIGRMKASLQDLFGSVENSRGMRTLQGFLQNLAVTLGGPQSRSALRSLVDALGDALKPLTGAEGRRSMEAFFESLTSLLTSAIPMLETAAKFTNALVLDMSGRRVPGAPNTVGEEATQIGRYFSPANNRLTAWIFGRTNDQFPDAVQQFSRPVVPGVPQRPVIHMNFNGNGPLDPDGIRKAVEREIAKQQRDAGPTEINDAFEQLGVQGGGP